MSTTTQIVPEEELRRLLQVEAMKLPDMDIAVSGIAGRFPKSDSVNEFEENLFEGVDMVNDQDDSRFTCGLWGLPPRAGRLKDLSKFDCEFFGFTPEEANYIDFQLRILYEVVYESILDAGLNPASLRGTNTGVFFGLHCNEFENAMADDPNFKSNGYYAQFAVKVAQYFDLKGITITFDAACASGFVGLHNAVESLRDGIVDQAIVCSCNIPIHPTGCFIFLQMQMLSPTGYSRFLDSKADGYVKSEACVSVLLQKKDLAIRNYASIMATMTNVDGYKPEGITFPSDKSQERLIRATKELAGISTNQIEYLEAHGTGTPAGDPQESKAIANVYFPSGDKSEMDEPRLIGPILVGSVKTNMGHSEAASGLCALAKVVLMLENEVIYPSLHYEHPNANIEALREGKLKFVDSTQELKAKIVPLSCYGFGGANVHAILRANHKEIIGNYNDNWLTDQRLIVMFGRSEEGLNAFFDNMLNTEGRNTRNCLSDDFLELINSINNGPIDRLMNHRGYMVIDSRKKQVSRCIKQCEHQVANSGARIHLQDYKERECILVLPGLSSEWPSSANGLQNFKPFWSTIERLVTILEPFKHQIDLVDLLINSNTLGLSTMSGKFVAIVAYEIALINMVKDQLKLKNLTNIVGHSIGEVSCAYASGIYGERETILVAYHLGRALDLNKHLIEGKMIAVELDELEGSKLVEGSQTLRISCINGPRSVTISGSTLEIDELISKLEQENIFFKLLDSFIALHNEVIMNKSIVQLLEDTLLNVLNPGSEYKLNNTAWLTSGVGLSDNSRANARFFAESICKKLDLLSTLNKLPDDSITLELGPSATLASQLMQVRAKSGKSKFHHAKLMKKSTEPKEKSLSLLKSIGELYQVGATFNLTSFHLGKKLNYPLRRQTPSLSSLIKWNHQDSLFVPRYPAQFSKSSAKSELPVDIVQDRDKYIVGHCIENRILYPATGYLFLIWRVFSFTQQKVYDACFHDAERELVPVEFHNVRLLRAVILGNRVAQIYVHYEEGTGKFEIKEGGSVVVEGYVRSPTDNPTGLLYDQVKETIKQENLALTMSSEDIYKQFRVSGYDYGETFQNIEYASSDGRYCKVKYGGHFVAFTDSILQSIFLAVTQYAPSGGLFLPTKFDYVRFQPSIILEKLHAARMPFDLTEGSLNTKAKREIMTKIMQRESGDANLIETTKDDTNEQQVEEIKPECIFETYCDPITGIIITDGIEMRGIKATPAPRRSDNNEVLLECYQFVRDVEDPVRDEHLTEFEKINKIYVDVCDTLAVDLLTRLSGRKSLNLNGLTNGLRSVKMDEIQAYLKSNLTESCNQENYDIKKNGNRMLLSVLDQLSNVKDPKKVKEMVHENRVHLSHDLIQAPFISERFMRPPIETIIENTCTKKMKLKLMEVNVGDGLMKEPMFQLIQSIEPTMIIDYSLAHPDLNRLPANIKAQTSNSRAYTLKNLSTLFNEQSVRDMDLIVYKDISCYSLPKQVIEQNGLAPTLTSLNIGTRAGGFVLIIMRNKLTLAERVLLALSEPELVGLSKKHLEQWSSSGKVTDAATKIEHINLVLEARCKQMMNEAEKNNMLCIGRRSDPSGCTMLLFKTTTKSQLSKSGLSHVASENRYEEARTNQIKKKILRVTHESEKSIGSWLEELKASFKIEEPKEKDQVDESQIEELPDQEQTFQVWLCAIATRQNPISGLIGMMQALRKEVGSTRLRCYYDAYSFKDCNEPIQISDIENCPAFQESLKRDLLWNCIDSRGSFGSYRHFTINKYMSYADCSCDEVNDKSNPRGQVRGAFVNYVTRGDLSSFSWFEAPYKYLDEAQQQEMVRVSYAALNFRDIMLATGRLPLDGLPLKLAMDDCMLGLEFSGYDWRGKRVMGMVPSRGIATHVLCPKGASIRIEIPDYLELRDATTMPVVYATAIMALIYRGRMKRGETVLIHAGSGGVGQAAIRLAAYHGLEIFATVGNDEKRKFLLEEFADCLDSNHIFSSRDCKFEDRIMQATRGRGVDLVLNSLADDKLQASIRCLADGGRFLEIGKYDMAVDARFELLALDTNKTFHGILLDKLFDVDDTNIFFKKQLEQVMYTLKDGLEKGYIRPIKYTTFKRNQIEEAFRFMATGKHIGKVLVEIDDQSLEMDPFAGTRIKCIPRFQLDPKKSYIITGGLGGFGLELTKWLVNQGARNILLTSRSGIKTGYQESTLRRLESSSGAKFLIVDNKMANTISFQGAKQLCEFALEMSPIKEIGGIFHLAMVLKDSLLENMSSEDFESVCKPKVDTCIHLDTLTRSMNVKLDLFVVFSSVTSGKGNAGQVNYAYANSCIERVCENRRQDGLHGLAIQWGAIGDVGVAFENLGGNNIIIGGTKPQRMPSCFATLSKLLCAPFSTCLSVLPVNRGPDSSGEKGDLVGAIMHVLGIKDQSKVSDQATLGELGLDSLMAVEIRQYIEREYDMTLNIQEIRSLTIAKIRDINDNGAPKSKSGATDTPGQPAQDIKEVQSYGQDLTKSKQIANSALDKQMVSSFLPQLELPKLDFYYLNYKQDGSNLQANGWLSDANVPLFFLPPIHGGFDQMELVCSNIKRPCYGLNWTRKLGRMRSLEEVVECYLELLEKTNWQQEFHVSGTLASNNRIVDLVGYSYGATIAFEIMLELYRRREKGSISLQPGNLILLDGSPRQIELGSAYLSNLTKKKPMKLTEKVDELLMVYILAHTRTKKVDYLKLQQSIVKVDLESKTQFASERLVEILGLNGDKQTQIAEAMEAFCRRYDIIYNYKAISSLPTDCTLIRAKKIYLSNQEQKYIEDLDLSSIVRGKVNLYIMEGDHESFLNFNHREIGAIICKHCNCS